MKNRDASFRIRVTSAAATSPDLTLSITCLGSGAGAGCPAIEAAPEGIASRVRSDGRRCIYWADRVPDEAWYIVELTYHRMKHVFAYVLPPGSAMMALPREAEPVPASVSVERCLDTKDVTITVTAVLPNQRATVIAVLPIIGECGT